MYNKEILILSINNTNWKYPEIMLTSTHSSTANVSMDHTLFRRSLLVWWCLAFVLQRNFFRDDWISTKTTRDDWRCFIREKQNFETGPFHGRGVHAAVRCWWQTGGRAQTPAGNIQGWGITQGMSKEIFCIGACVLRHCGVIFLPCTSTAGQSYQRGLSTVKRSCFTACGKHRGWSTRSDAHATLGQHIVVSHEDFIFSAVSGGIDPINRKGVWRYLFGLFPFHSTARWVQIAMLASQAAWGPFSYRTVPKQGVCVAREWVSCCFQRSPQNLKI